MHAVIALLLARARAQCAADAPGMYCRGGYAYPCLAGYYGATTGLTSPTCTGACAAAPGLGCAAGSVSAGNATQCPRGYFCPGGSPAAAIPCVVRSNCDEAGLG